MAQVSEELLKNVAEEVRKRFSFTTVGIYQMVASPSLKARFTIAITHNKETYTSEFELEGIAMTTDHNINIVMSVVTFAKLVAAI